MAKKVSDHRTTLLGVAGARLALGVVALPLAPFLYREHFAVLVLMRPTKEVLLAAGFLARAGDVSLPVVLAATVPLLVLGVWLFYWLGRAYAEELRHCDLPSPANRLLPPERIDAMHEVIRRKGTRVVFLGRLAAFPSTLVAAAAGSADVPSRRFLLADGLGVLVSIVEVVGAGLLLGDAYKEAGPWLTAAGVALLAALAVLMGRWLRRVA